MALGKLPGAINRAKKALETDLASMVGQGFDARMSLADLYLESDDLDKAEDVVNQALALQPPVSRRHRAQALGRLGVIYSRQEKYRKAVEQFENAHRLNPEDLKLKTNLAEAYLKQKRADRAEAVYQEVLSLASGNIEALLGMAQVSVAAAEAGNGERFQEAERHLTAALTNSNEHSGSKILESKERADAHYLLGYVRLKQYEMDSAGVGTRLLSLARKAFADACESNPDLSKAQVAFKKLKVYQGRQRRSGLVEILGPLIVCVFAVAVFVMTQVSYYRPQWIHLEPMTAAVSAPAVVSAPGAVSAPATSPRPPVTPLGVTPVPPAPPAPVPADPKSGPTPDPKPVGMMVAAPVKPEGEERAKGPGLSSAPGYYVLATFGALVFLVAGLYLPKVLKLKVGVIELEKGAVDQISTPLSSGISGITR
jgi:tetratricopeptide (TPR) repeat protein